MGTLSLTDPVNGTVADATLIANNDSAILTVVNGGLDNSNITAGAAIDATKLSVPYADYSPTWTTSGTAPAIGNSTSTARYAQIGKVVHAYGVITFGSTATYGSGAWSFALPVTAGSSNTGQAYGTVDLRGTTVSSGIFGSASVGPSAGTWSPYYFVSYGGAPNFVTATSPWTWAATDFVAWNFTYESV